MKVNRESRKNVVFREFNLENGYLKESDVKPVPVGKI